MTNLAPICLDDGTIIYIEATENVRAASIPSDNLDDEEESVVTRGMGPADRQKLVVQSFQAIEGTIRAYTFYSLNAFRKLAIANVDEVTLQFGIEIGGEAGIPYITKGQAKSNLNITVKCSFPK
jgi:hypothetical protein